MYAPVYRVELVRDGRQEVRSRVISQPEDIVRILERYLGRSDREVFVAVGLSTKSRIIGVNTVSIGILDATLVHPREVFKSLILMNASHAIVSHNHPSGYPFPSCQDEVVT